TLDRPARAFDADTITRFLKGKPEVVVVYGQAEQKELAGKLAADLTGKGIKATVKPDAEVLRKVAYPRVWNPFAMVYSPTGAEKKPAGMVVKTEVSLGVDKEGKLTARTGDGKEVSSDLRQPNSLVTIVGDGFVDYTGDRELCYEPGVKIYYNE